MKVLQSKFFIVLITLVCVIFLLIQLISVPAFKSIKSFHLLELNDGILKGKASLLVENYNWFSVNGKELEVDLIFKNKLFAKGAISNFKLNKKHESTIVLNFDFYLDSLEKDMQDIFFKDSILITVKMNGKFSFLQINGSRELSMWLKTKDLLNPLVESIIKGDGLKIKSIKLAEFELKHSVFQVAFDFKNKLPIPITLKKIQFSIQSEKNSFTAISDWDFKLNKVLQSNQIETIDGQATIDNFNAAFSGLDKLLKGKTDGYLVGFLLLELNNRAIKIPMKQHFEVDILSREITILKD